MIEPPAFDRDGFIPETRLPMDDGRGGEAVPPEEPALPDYEILDFVGRGGMGVVYRARQRKLDRIVALKCLLPYGPPLPTRVARLQREARAVARLQHPHIIQIFDVGEHQGRPFLALEFVAGGTLEQRLRTQPPTLTEAVHLIEILARAVHAAHQAGLLHRDLKPANILLTSTGVPKISDFGLAAFVGAVASPAGPDVLTTSGTIMGTPAYMAPEQVRGEHKALGPATDVYALGTMFYQMLTGQVPFWAPSVFDLFRLVVEQPPEPPRRLRPHLPPQLEAICLKCLAKRPEDRYRTALDLAEDLRRFLDDRKSGEPTVPASTNAWPRARGHRLIPLGGVLALLLGLSLLVAEVRPRGEPSVPAGPAAAALEPKRRKEQRVPRPAQGLEIREVEPNSPAAHAGLKAGDVLVEGDGRPLATYADWLRAANLDRLDLVYWAGESGCLRRIRLEKTGSRVGVAVRRVPSVAK